MRLIEIVMRLGFGALWIYAGLIKLADPGKFLIDIRSYQLLSDPWAPMVALFLPWVELLCGAVIVFGRPLYRGALALLLGALLVFLVGIVSSWARGLDISCGCFGGDGTSSYPWLVTRDLLLIAVGGFLWLRSSSSSPPEPL